MMVTIVGLSIGLLCIVGLQAATLKYKINTWARSSASTLVSDLSELERMNPDSAGNRFAETGADIASKYVIGDAWAAQQSAALDPIRANCETEPCTPLQPATHHLH